MPDHTFVLLNSGDYALLNDGTSKIILNEGAEEPGVIISGTHAIQVLGDPKPKLKQYELTAGGKISRVSVLMAFARIQRIVSFEAYARLLRVSESAATAKITRLHEHIATSDTFQRIRAEYSLDATASTFERNEDKERQARATDAVDRFVRESKVAKLKKLFDLYREESDEI